MKNLILGSWFGRAAQRSLTGLALLFLPVALAAQSAEPAAVFLTWSDDPTRTVTVDWHLMPGADIERVEVRGPGLDAWTGFSGSSFEFPFSERTVRRAHVTGLRPDAEYELRFGVSERVFRYRTMPARHTRPIRFATGGDTNFSDDTFGRTNRAVAARDLDFVVFGGDLSYANGDPRRAARKEEWFETVTRTLVTDSGRLIPVLVAIGNHEVFSHHRFDDPAEAEAFSREHGVENGESTYFTPLFAKPRNHRFGVVDFGDYLSIMLLNSGHTAGVGGEQAAWLAKTLAARERVTHVFPVYHVPAYPSVRSFEGSTSREIRDHWVPLFERHGVRIAFENHDHVYKRTVPLREGRRDPQGIVYIGDGAWGVSTREIGRDHDEPVWYLERSASTNHGVIVTLSGADIHVAVIDAEGTVIDEYGTRASIPAAEPAGSSSPGH